MAHPWTISVLAGFIFHLLPTFVHATEAPRTGEFRIERTSRDLMGAVDAASYASVLAADLPIEWDVYVPASNDAASPAGVFVYISPTPSGEIPELWKRVIDDHNLIWISARKSGNSAAFARRAMYTILGLTALQEEYILDKDRFYLGGYSGGGRAASIVSTTYPTLFSGAVYICGANFWQMEDEAMLVEVRNNRYVFITGHQDFNRQETKRRFNDYKNAGAKNIKLVDLSYLTHDLPRAPEFEEAIKFLDERETLQ